MSVRRLAISLVFIISVVLTGCGAGEYRITSHSIAGKDGSIITAEEREMIRGLTPFFIAISNKDIKRQEKQILTGEP